MQLPASFLARFAARELRALLGRGALFVACLAVGVAAVTGVAGLGDALDSGLRRMARDLLAADVAATSREPIPAPLVDAARAIPGARTALVTQAFSMAAAASGRSTLVEVKAIEGGWPFYGKLVLDPQRPLDELLSDDSVLVAPALARRLGLQRGDAIKLGDATMTIAGFVVEEPDHAIGRIAIAPRVLLTQEAVERTHLLEAGSRQDRKLLVALPDGADARATAKSLAHAGGDSPYVQVESREDAQPELRKELRRGARFLGLVALLSLVIGGAGIAQASRAWLRSRMETMALLRCLGLRPRDVVAIFVSIALALGVLGSLAGAAVGLALLRFAPAILGEIIEGIPVATWQPRAAAQGVGLGLLCALAFATPSLVELARVPALRALRASAEPPPPSRLARLVLAGALLLAGLAAATLQAGAFVRGAIFVALLAITGLALAGAALGSTRLLTKLATSGALAGRAVPRLAAHALARPGSGTLSATVALGLGVLVVGSVLLVQAGMRQELLARLPTGAPSAFLIDVQPSQWDAVRGLLESQGATSILSTPMVTSRLKAIDDRDVADIVQAREGRQEWALTREQRLTWWSALPEDNTLVEGALWSDPARPEVSVEEGFAHDLGLKIGTKLTLDVQGAPIDAWVTSIRRVEWRTFRINFFLVVEPGVLDQAPHSILAAARLPEGREESVQDALVALAPNVTVVPIREALERFSRIVARLAGGVRAVGAFSVVAGLAILAGAVAAGASRRAREIALLKTLGLTRGGVARMLLLEHASLGFVAGAIGVVGASVVSWLILAKMLELPWHLRAPLLLACVGATVTLSALSGTIACAGALRASPMESLRREE